MGLGSCAMEGLVNSGPTREDGSVNVIYVSPNGAGTALVRSQVLAGLIGAVNSGEGTAYFAFRNYAGPTFAGKTGTAQVNNGKKDDTSWFVGFTNAENDPNQPQYVVLAMVEQAGFGAEVSALIAARVAEYLTGNPNPPAVHVGSAPTNHD